MKLYRKKVNSIQFEYGHKEQKDLMCVSEWQNGEGWNIDFGDGQMIILSWDAKDALDKAIMLIGEEIEED